MIHIVLNLRLILPFDFIKCKFGVSGLLGRQCLFVFMKHMALTVLCNQCIYVELILHGPEIIMRSNYMLLINILYLSLHFKK